MPGFTEEHQPSTAGPRGAVVTAYCTRCHCAWPCPQAVLGDERQAAERQAAEQAAS